MHYHWLSEQRKLGSFKIYWDKGENNIADYHSKYHPPSYHQKVRSKYSLKNYNIMINKNIKLSIGPNGRNSLHVRVCF